MAKLIAIISVIYKRFLSELDYCQLQLEDYNSRQHPNATTSSLNQSSDANIPCLWPRSTHFGLRNETLTVRGDLKPDIDSIQTPMLACAPISERGRLIMQP